MANDDTEQNLESDNASSDTPKSEKTANEANEGLKADNVRLAVQAKLEVTSTEAGPLTKDGVKRMAIIDDGVDLVKKGGAGRADKDVAGNKDSRDDKSMDGASDGESSERAEDKRKIVAGDNGNKDTNDKNRVVGSKENTTEPDVLRKVSAVESENSIEIKAQDQLETGKVKLIDDSTNIDEEDKKVLEKLSAPRNTKTSTVFGSPEIAYKGDVVKEAVEPKPGLNLELSEIVNAERISKPTERIDENTGIKYTYDQQGRITDFKTPEGKTSKFEYRGDATQPSSVEMNDKDGKPVLKLEGAFQLDKDGVLTQKHELTDSNGAKIETRFTPDGIATKTQYDEAGRRLMAEKSEATADGVKILGKTEFLYSDKNGKPTQDSASIDDSKPIQSITHDDKFRVTERYQYASRQELEESKPSTREEISYEENPALLTASEKHVGYAYHPETGVAQPVVSSEKIQFTDTGVTAVYNKQANGTEQHMQYDKDGKPLILTRSEYDQNGEQRNYNFNIKDGKIVDALKDNVVLKGEQAEQAKKLGELLLAQGIVQNNIEQRAEKGIDRSITPPREGETPSGTLVWKDGGTLRQASVEAGTIKDDSGKAIGTVNDKGAVSFNDAAAKSFNISDSEGAAFHGVGSDTARLDLAPAKASESYSGSIVAADGSQKYSVVGGNLYDSSGKFYAQMDKLGKLHFPNDNPPPTNINSQLEGHKFVGTENGKNRTMDCAANAPSGKIFIPDEKNGKPQEYEVRMGMILNKSTNEQVGILKAPTETADGKLVGGTITMNGEKPKELADFKDAVFDLQLNEEGNRQSRRIQGASLGHIERMADGTPKPGQGGLFNIQDAVDTQKHKVDTAEAKLLEQQRFFNRASGIAGKNGEVEGARDMARLQSDETNGILKNMLETGQTRRLEYVQQITAGAKDYGIEDKLLLKRREIDHSGKNLEDLPKDTKQLNGTVRLPKDDANAGVHEVKDGKVLGAGGKPIGSIDSATGEMTWLDQKSGQASKINMRDLNGAVWNLNYKDSNGEAKDIAWISQGDKGIVSIKDLKAKAAQEVLYAELVNSKAQSELSGKNAKLTEENARTFNERLDRIAKEGLQDGDAQFLSDGAGKFVRTPEAASANSEGALKQQAPRQCIEIPELRNENIQDVNGDLRLGNQVFKIDHGKLKEVHYKDGKAVVDEIASGQLGPNYTVELPGRQIDLARENRVLMQFTVGNQTEKHQIIGLGPGRQTADKGYQAGGLIESKELYRRSMEIRQQANEGNRNYFANKPWLTGTLVDMSGTFEEQEQHLRTYSDRLDKTVKDVQERSNNLFQDGFNPEKLYNNKLDASIDVTQNLMDYIGATATASKDSATDYKATQKELADAATMAAITVATAGAGSVFSAAATAGRITVGAAYAAELGTGVLAGSVISVAGRASDSSNWKDNAIAGGLEGGAMAFGSVFGKAVGAINDVRQLKTLADMKNAGQVLAAEEAALLNTAVGKLALQGASEMQIKAAYYSTRFADALVSTTAFTVASEVKEKGLDYVMQHKIETLQKGDLLAGTAWNLAGQAVGHAFGSFATNATKGGDGRLAKAFQENGIGNRMLNDTVNSFTNGGLGAMNAAYDAERERIGQELGIDKNLVTGDLLRERANYASIIGTMAEAGWSAALSAPIMTVATHPFVAAGEHAAKNKPADHATQSHDNSPTTPNEHGANSRERPSVLSGRKNAENSGAQATKFSESRLRSTPEVIARPELKVVAESLHRVNEQVSQRPQKGSTIEFNGEPHTLVTYDSKTGDAILRRIGAEGSSYQKAPADLETNPNYTKLRVDGQTYYRDSEGKFHKQLELKGEHFLMHDPQLKSVPRDQISQKFEKKAEQANPASTAKEGFLHGRDLYLNGNKVDGVGQEFNIGRMHQPDMLHDRYHLNVSRDHLTLRQDADGRMFVKDTSSSGTYRERSDGTWERLPKGKEVVLNPNDKLRLGSEHGAELNFKDRGALTPSRNQPASNLMKGSQVEYDGKKYFVSGFDRNNGDVVLCRPNYGKEFQLESVPLTPEFKPLQLGKETYYKKTDGSVWQKVGPEGHEVLMRNYELQAVPRDRKSEIKPTGVVQRDNVKVPDKPEPEVRKLSPNEIRRRNEGEYLTQYLGKERSTEMQAILQTNEMATKHIVTDRLHDGFQLSIFEGVGVSSDGRMHVSFAPNVVLDRAQDKVLNRVTEQAHAKFDHLKSDPRKLATELTKFAKEILHPKGWSEFQLDKAYEEKFQKPFAGKRLLLGEIINRAEKKEFGGVCSQQALLLKVLGDSFGIETKLITGNYEPRKRDGTIDVDNSGPHAWTEMKIDGKWQLFDPRQEIHGEPPEKHRDHAFFKDLSDAKNAYYLDRFGGMDRGLRRVSAAKEQYLPEHFGLDVKHGDKMDYLGFKDWTVTGHNEADGTVTLTRDGSLSNLREDMIAMNPEVKRFEIGGQYTARSLETGQPEPGWTLIGLDSNKNAMLAKKDGFSMSVPAAAILQDNPSIARQRVEVEVAAPLPVAPGDSAKALRPLPRNLNFPDTDQMVLQSAPIRLGAQQGKTFGSQHLIMNADLTLPSGDVQKVLFHCADTQGEGAAVKERFRKEMACYKINELLGLENGFPTTAARETLINGKKRTGFIQDKSGIPFDTEISTLAKKAFGTDDAPAVSKLLSSNSALESQIEQAFVERLIYGCADNIAGNFVIVQDGAQQKVRNIDLDLAFKGKSVNELMYSSEANKPGVSRHIRDHFSGKDVSPALLDHLDSFVQRFDNSAGIASLFRSGLKAAEITEMLDRAKWFVNNKRFP